MLKDFTKEKFDIIILAGQSNGEGYGVGPVDEPYEPNDSVWYMNRDLAVTRGEETVDKNEIRGTLGLPFAREYIKGGFLGEGRKLLILRAAEGGTGFVTGEWKLEDRAFILMMEMIRTALSLNSENRIVCFLWHQGENEVVYKTSYDVHYENLSALVRAVQDEFGVGDIPFIGGDLVPGWKEINGDDVSPVVCAIRDVFAECRRGAFVETDGLKSNIQELKRMTCGWEDHIHFSRNALYILGKRYFDAFVSLQK